MSRRKHRHSVGEPGTIPECWTSDPTYARPRDRGWEQWIQRWAIWQKRRVRGWFRK